MQRIGNENNKPSRSSKLTSYSSVGKALVCQPSMSRFKFSLVSFRVSYYVGEPHHAAASYRVFSCGASPHLAVSFLPSDLIFKNLFFLNSGVATDDI